MDWHKPCSFAAWNLFEAMAKPVARHAFVVKSALRIGSVIDFLVLILAVFFMFFGIDFLIFLVLKRGPSKSNKNI